MNAELLKSALDPLRDQMTEEESKFPILFLWCYLFWIIICYLFFLFAERRNQLGEVLVFCGKNHPGYSFFRGLFEGEPTEKKNVFDLNPEHFHGFYGHVLQSDVCVKDGG